MVPPDEFIPDMESNGLIRQLGREILKQAAVVLSDKSQANTPISINVSARELADESWCVEFVEQLKKYKIPGSKITIEVTESAALGISERLESDLKWLRKRNVGVHLDDFGTGFASIGTLIRIPATALKLDQSFVQKITTDEASREVVAAIAKLAKGLGLETIAEGVETEEQRKILIKCGWTYGQGYLFGKPEAAQ
jgi:EAL domain-containing protein (putative c-di-GMP-specific phosphodiesterase class I)